jgi:hypothetical protein
LNLTVRNSRNILISSKTKFSSQWMIKKMRKLFSITLLWSLRYLNSFKLRWKFSNANHAILQPSELSNCWKNT